MDKDSNSFDAQEADLLDAGKVANPVVEADEEPEQVELGARPPMDDEMDITPMIDMTFLLLIFFILTSKMTGENRTKYHRQSMAAPSLLRIA